MNINGVGVFLGRTDDDRGDNSTEAVRRHIDHAVQLIGQEHVGFGLDYVFDVSELEGYVKRHPELFPADIRAPGGYPSRAGAVSNDCGGPAEARGYGDDDVLGIMGLNNLRIASQVWRREYHSIKRSGAANSCALVESRRRPCLVCGALDRCTSAEDALQFNSALTAHCVEAGFTDLSRGGARHPRRARGHRILCQAISAFKDNLLRFRDNTIQVSP